MKITLSGFPGAGKTTTGKNASEELNIDFLSIGDLRGKYAESLGITIDELNEQAENNPETDIKADEYQKEFSAEHDDFLVESRLGYFFMPESLKIYLDVSEEESARRLLNTEREDEPLCNSLEERIKKTRERIKSDKKRYNQLYNTNPYDKEQYDVIINTTNFSPQRVAKIIKAKAVDYHQKMFPLQFYLGHPTKGRKEIREWELEFEKKTGITLKNPFHDCNTQETEMGHLNESKYSILKEDSSNLFRGDLEEEANKRTIGGIFLFGENYSIGTPAEMMANKLMGKLTYSVVNHPEKDYFYHPTIRFLSDEVFSSFEELTDFLKNNQTRMFKLLEDSRRKTSSDKTFKKIYREISKNYLYRTQ